MPSLREWARELKHQTLMVYYAVRDPRTPWHARLVAGLIVAYAISPIDLIPDVIPVVGYLDEIILLPAAIWLALKLLPADVLEAARQKAEQTAERPTSIAAVVTIVLIWVILTALFGWWIYRAVT